MTGGGRHLSLTQRLFALIALALVPAFVALLYFIVSIHREREDEVEELALRTSELASLEMDRIVSGAEGILQALAHAPVMRSPDPEACRQYLATLISELPQFAGIAVADNQGIVRCSTEPSGATFEIGDRPFFSEAIERGGFTVGTFTRSRLQVPVGSVSFLPLAVPLRTEGQITGVAVGALDLGWLGRRLREREYVAGNAMTVADRDGIILAREPEPERYVGTPIVDEFMTLVNQHQPGTIEMIGRDGTRRIVGYQPPAATQSGLFVGAGLSTEQAFAPIYASTYRSLALAGTGAVAAFGVAWLVGNRLFRQPIRQLLNTVAAWRRGDIAARSGIRATGSELSILAGAIDQYMDEVVVSRAARDESEAHRALLVAEMEHRVKNLLATVQAMANQTFKDKAAPEAIQAFGQRMAAMAATHKVLLADNWEHASLRATLEAALEPFGLARGDRLTLGGPPLHINARATLSLSMAVHELCTNAAKYGALSTLAGKVEIEWRIRLSDHGDRFVLCWTERDGPAVQPPATTGFGTRMIRSAMASQFEAEVDLVFAPPGVICTIEAEAGRILAEPAAVAGAA